MYAPIQAPVVVQQDTQAHYAHVATVRAYKLAFKSGEVSKECGASFDAERATMAADMVITSESNQWGIDSTEEMNIRAAAIEGYTHGYYGYEAMSNASIAMHFD